MASTGLRALKLSCPLSRALLRGSCERAALDPNLAGPSPGALTRKFHPSTGERRKAGAARAHWPLTGLHGGGPRGAPLWDGSQGLLEAEGSRGAITLAHREPHRRGVGVTAGQWSTPPNPVIHSRSLHAQLSTTCATALASPSPQSAPSRRVPGGPTPVRTQPALKSRGRSRRSARVQKSSTALTGPPPLLPLAGSQPRTGTPGRRLGDTPEETTAEKSEISSAPEGDEVAQENPESPEGYEGPEPMPLYRIPSGILPSARNSRIKSAEFVKSSSDVSQCPQGERPEIAVIGRSNVGKSSLINMLTNRRALAQTSKKPGKTQLINHFLINGSWYLVDLPGYGYAKAPTAVRDDWHAFTRKYFQARPNLATVLLLVDASIPPLQVDLDCADWMGQNKIPLTVVFTKCDRKKKKKNGGRPPAENVADFEQRLAEYYEELPPWIMTSSTLGMGKDTLLSHITQVISHWKS